MKKAVAVLMSFILLLIYISTGISADSSSLLSQLEVKQIHSTSVKGQKRVLMIGNSYTLCNESDQILQKLCQTAGKNIQVTRIAKGGASLAYHADSSTNTGKKIDHLLRTKKWDYVILQDRHYYPIAKPRSMKKAVHSLAPRIKASGAKIAFFMTWAPGYRHPDYQNYKHEVKNRREYQKKIASVYEELAKEVDGIVIPVGYSFMRAKKTTPNIHFLRQDQSHPTYAGSYLAANTIYSTLFGGPHPSYCPKEHLSSATARKLQKTAKATSTLYKSNH